MKIKPLVIHSDDEKYLHRLHTEYVHYVGMVAKLFTGKLVVYPWSGDSPRARRV